MPISYSFAITFTDKCIFSENVKECVGGESSLWNELSEASSLTPIHVSCPACLRPNSPSSSSSWGVSRSHSPLTPRPSNPCYICLWLGKQIFCRDLACPACIPSIKHTSFPSFIWHPQYWHIIESFIMSDSPNWIIWDWVKGTELRQWKYYLNGHWIPFHSGVMECKGEVRCAGCVSGWNG